MRRASSAGPNGVSWGEYRKNFQQNLEDLSSRIASGKWSPGSTRDVTVRFFTGKIFDIAIPNVEDRIVHRAIRNAVEPILERKAFPDFVSGFRRYRSRLTSVRQAMEHWNSGYRFVADIDVEDVSGTLPVDNVVDWMAEWVSDGAFLNLFRTALYGLPSPLAVGSGLSPMLINVRLVPVDRLLQGERVVRFSDNYCIFCSSLAEAEEAFDKVRRALAFAGLSPSKTKSHVRSNSNPEDLFLISG